MSRYVDPILGQHRPATMPLVDGHIGRWRRRDGSWARDAFAYRCEACRAVVPWSVWSSEERRRFVLGGVKPERCRDCK